MLNDQLRTPAKGPRSTCKHRRRRKYLSRRCDKNASYLPMVRHSVRVKLFVRSDGRILARSNGSAIEVIYV
jgi:hypothetical protein